MKEIRKIIEAYDTADHGKESFALACLVGLEESSYRRIGARMLVSSSGHWIGGISGGCLEGDALQKAQKVIFKGLPAKIVYDTRSADYHEIGIGLGCQGKIEVLFLPINPADSHNPIEQLRRIIAENSELVQLHVIGDVPGTHKLGQTEILADSSQNIEIAQALEVDMTSCVKACFQTKKSKVHALKNAKGQAIEILVEYHRPRQQIVIIGDNYDIHAMIRMAHELGWEINLVANKRKLSKDVYALVSQIYGQSEISEIKIGRHTAIALMSHDYATDLRLLPHLLKQSPAYLGILGPKKRAQRLQNELKLDNLDNIHFVYSPIGLDIGAENPEEIAVSIFAEILTVLRKRNGQSLKFRKGTIHERE